MSTGDFIAAPAGTAGSGAARQRVLVIAPPTPAWAATLRALRESCEAAEFEVLAPPVGPSDLEARLRGKEPAALVVVVDLDADASRSMSLVSACRQLAPSVPVVVVASSPTPELVRRIRLSGVFFLALQPVGAEEMRNVLEGALDCAARRRARSSTCRDRRRILLIDDDADFLASTKGLLEAQGYSVSTAVSGREGLARVTAEAPDLIVLDIMMENEWAGYEVNQRVKFGDGFECIRHVPILMVSSIPVDPATRFSRSGEVPMVTPDAYLTKPVDIQAFLAQVRALIGGQDVEVVP